MTQPQQCLRRIQLQYDDLSKTEKKIADYIIGSPEDIVYKTIDQVAEELNVAISTVFRFTKTMGFKGFQAMKIALASEIAEPIREIVQDQIEAKDKEQAITENIFNQNIRMFKETMQAMDYGSIKKAVNLIVNADSIQFYGFESSGIVAVDAHHKFMDTGISTASYTDYHMQLKAASLLKSNDIVILISRSGTDDNMLKVLELVKQRGIKTICITDKTSVKLNKQANIVLKTATMKGESGSEETLSRIVQLSLIDSLYVNVMSVQTSLVNNTIGKIKNYLGKHKV